jgi:hypothetical protein
MPVIRAPLAGPGRSPTALDAVRAGRATASSLSHVLIAAHAARAGRLYLVPHPCSAAVHAAIKSSERMYAAATINRRPWSAAGMEIAECPCCRTSICLRVEVTA